MDIEFAFQISLVMDDLENHLDLQDRIRNAAYFKWVEAGRPAGQDVEFWLEAEEEARG